jgi:branched-subunit amino acid aminotransferase/4-amino-4-deoxychorismate lyase
MSSVGIAAMGASVSADDWGLLYGYGLFETLRTYHGFPFQLDRHVDRMLASARDLRFERVPSRTAILDEVSGFCRQAGDAVVRFTLTRGNDSLGQGPQLLVTQRPVAYTAAQYRSGVAVTIAATTRDAESPIVRHKTLNQLQNILAWRDAIDEGFDECLFLDNHRRLSEGSRSNVFVVSRGMVTTPARECGLLPGITRDTVIAILRDLDCPVSEQIVTLGELVRCDECFLTNSVMQVMPVNRIGQHLLPAGGGIAHRVSVEYAKRVRRAAASRSVPQGAS